MNDQSKTASVTLEDSLFKRIMAWSDERFPISHSIAFITLFLVSALLARSVSTDGEVVFYLSDIVSAIVATSFFLVLRVFDEHKDYELDCHNHPQRILQSGLITLKHLKIIGVVSVLSQLLWSLFLDKGISFVTYAWFVAFGWSCLMAKEFFCGEWLEKRLTLYAFSHMLVMPMIMWWLMQIGSPGIQFESTLVVFLVLSFIGGFSAEIVRKTRGPEEERETVDSYSKIFGTKGSAWVVLSLVTLMCGLQAYISSEIASKNFIIGYGVIFLGYFLCVSSLIKFIKNPSLAGREKNEAATAIAMLLGYFAIIGAVIYQHGIQFAI